MADSEATDEARRLLGRQLAAYRRAAGYNQHQFASLVRYTRSTIGNVETGRQKPPRDFWMLCDELLDTGGVLVASHDSIHRRERQQEIEAVGPLSVGKFDSLATDPQRQQTSPEADAEPSTPSHVETLLAGLTIGQFSSNTSIDDQALDDLSVTEQAELLLKLFLKLDDEQGGNELILPLSRYVADMARKVDREPGIGLSAFGQLSQLAGWIALDSGRQSAARRYWNATVYAAHEADDSALAASALAYMSLQDTYRGRTKSALSLAQTAFETSGGSITPLVRTMLATRLARAHAAAGNKTAALRALELARRAFGTPSQQVEPLWISYVDQVEVTAQIGACYLELGMTKPAGKALVHALRLIDTTAPDRTRDSVHYLSRLARCHLLDYEVERACETATEAVSRAATLGSARVVAQLQEFFTALEPFSDNRAAKEFRALFEAARSGD
ncbi:helix-turn-helix transcriptional regulator [Plantactinospora sp. B5E13]|uniref:helix-turn-helix domain-containing protein n=1 Tax=unclassified Plantactinospora TaxID=2631981 RepID=UPI00325ECE26